MLGHKGRLEVVINSTSCMITFITYIFILVFSIGSLQASVNCCLHMDMQDNSSSSMSDEQTPCHSMGDEIPAEEDSDNSCCEGGCDTCLSTTATFDTQSNIFEQTYINSYTQSVSFAFPSNHIKIPTPPPNS